MRTVEIVTCSYAPDFEMCRILCESVGEFVAPSIGHTLVVPRRDRALFSPLCNMRTKVIVAEDILPGNFWRVPLLKKFWIIKGWLPVRGWIMQQILKLSAPIVTSADVIVHVDSDTCFLRPFSEGSVIRDGAVRLYRDPNATEMMPHIRWHQSAAKLLGLPPTKFFGADYTGQLISWRRETVLSLHEHLQERFAVPWQLTLARTFHFAEYILYGVYVEHLLRDTSNHYYAADSLCHSSWVVQFATRDGLAAFISGMRPDQVMAHIQSTERLPIDERAAIFRQIAAQLSKHDVESDSK
jgi:hypothetical protein